MGDGEIRRRQTQGQAKTPSLASRTIAVEIALNQSRARGSQSGRFGPRPTSVLAGAAARLEGGREGGGGGRRGDGGGGDARRGGERHRKCWRLAGTLRSYEGQVGEGGEQRRAARQKQSYESRASKSD